MTKPSQLDRVTDILDGKAMKKSIKMIRNCKLPSGKLVTLRTAPFSMFSRDEYTDPKDFTEDLRANDPEQFLTKGVDFITMVHQNYGKKKSETGLSHKKATPLMQGEIDGRDTRWGIGNGATK
jgi:hypothetical protein